MQLYAVLQPRLYATYALFDYNLHSTFFYPPTYLTTSTIPEKQYTLFATYTLSLQHLHFLFTLYTFSTTRHG
ncbi:hypothetical protein E2C01_057506 [Portunus trituberculatus]|uniref:Uncharacterized protein n=1 Tax=Portunus trituberculatus TaxID=210409 RepID=A0A5B7H2L5_PORTR|nr:hypothetical protein [Portunus trituberculatus]